MFQTSNPCSMRTGNVPFTFLGTSALITAHVAKCRKRRCLKFPFLVYKKCTLLQIFYFGIIIRYRKGLFSAFSFIFSELVLGAANFEGSKVNNGAHDIESWTKCCGDC